MALPKFDVQLNFDLIYTYATLHYVKNPEEAIKSMYRCLKPGGFLICNYANDETQKIYEKAENDDLRKRFSSVIKGESVLSRNQISSFLDENVIDFWEFVNAEGEYVRDTNPCIFIRKY